MAKRILIIAGDYTEDYEIMVPYQTLLVCGFDVDVICPDKKPGDTIATAIHDFIGKQTYTETPGHNFTINANFDTVTCSDYDGLFLTGGRAPEYLRLNERVLAITRWFMEHKQPVAAICHGIQILTAADCVRGRTLTAYPAIEPEVIQAGGTFVRKEADESVVDGNLVTAPAWPGNVAILRDFIKKFGD